MSGARGRAGTSAVELLVALVLTAGLASLGWAVFAAHRRVAEGISRRADLLAAERVTRVVLATETAAGAPGRDWDLLAPGVVTIRAFRGWAAVCAPLGRLREGDDLFVSYEGLRQPEPDKDSVLSIEADGSWVVAALAWRTAAGEACPGTGGPALERWGTDPPLRDPILLRVFERGSYHLDDGALRYRIGAAGRQPLTPAAFDPRASGIGSAPGQGLVLVLRGRDGLGGGWRRTLDGNGGGAP